MKEKPIEVTALPSWMRPWERFWFTPTDPTLLGAIRILTGLLVVYTLIAYSFSLQSMMGEHAWVDLKLRQQIAHDSPHILGTLDGNLKIPPTPKAPTDPDQVFYLTAYFENFITVPNYGILPCSREMVKEFAKLKPEEYELLKPHFDELIKDVEKMKPDERARRVPPIHFTGLEPPRDRKQYDYLVRYTLNWRQPPPAYAETDAEAEAIDDYIVAHNFDPRTLYARGSPIWSVWLHVTDPTAMAWIHAAFILVAILFTAGIGTRVTSVLTWFAMLTYIHRNVHVLFGVDTMMNIILLYLMIGPSGAALSVDRLIARWWAGRTGPEPPPAPSVTATIATRLLQIHVCVIYLMAGASKLQGQSWWNGTALWSVLANYEFAPMQYGLYNDMLRFLAKNQLAFDSALTMGCYFTLVFEISYVFLIWLPRTRWVFLGSALMLHGVIGIFMGLKTFSMVMLVMNLAFVRPDEVHRFLAWLGAAVRPRRPAVAAPPPPEPVAVAATANTKK